MDTLGIEQIYQKLQTDWADWSDAEDGCLSICKRELMAAIQTINAYLTNYDLKTRIEKDPTAKVCEFCEGNYKGAEPICHNCLLSIKFGLRRLSCLLNEEDLRKVYTERIEL
ncbi:MAG: hypothetical protein ACXVI5_03950 [Halobacteriota archaeon]